MGFFFFSFFEVFKRKNSEAKKNNSKRKINCKIKKRKNRNFADINNILNT